MFGEYLGQLFRYEYDVLSLRNPTVFSVIPACTYVFNIKYEVVLFSFYTQGSKSKDMLNYFSMVTKLKRSQQVTRT